MPTILSAKESQVMLAGADGGAGQPIEGLQAINFKIDLYRQMESTCEGTGAG